LEGHLVTSRRVDLGLRRHGLAVQGASQVPVRKSFTHAHLDGTPARSVQEVTFCE